jgi:hypothetical protein
VFGVNPARLGKGASGFCAVSRCGAPEAVKIRE